MNSVRHTVVLTAGGALTRRPQVAVAVFSLAALMSAACASTNINRILADPSHYRDRQVRLSGSVVDSYSFANRGAYRLGDESGQLWVVSDTGVPRKGARVTVRGTIREGFNLGSLGDRINLPAVGSGLVLMESSHKAGR
jgi:membrane protein implicated in regulation of membrane protease activity